MVVLVKKFVDKLVRKKGKYRATECYNLLQQLQALSRMEITSRNSNFFLFIDLIPILQVINCFCIISY